MADEIDTDAFREKLLARARELEDLSRISAEARGALLSTTAPVDSAWIDDATLQQRDTGSLVPVEFTERNITLPGMSILFQGIDYDDDGDLDVVTFDGSIPVRVESNRVGIPVGPAGNRTVFGAGIVLDYIEI